MTRDCASALTEPYRALTNAKMVTVEIATSGTVGMTAARLWSPMAGSSSTMNDGKLPGNRVSAVT